jgi:HTH-type transcriptional regulator, competence development regulator
MLGAKLKELRELNGYVQRQIAAELEVDTAYISKVENDEKPLSKIHLKKLSKIYKITERELLTIWLTDKIKELVKNEPTAKESILLVLNEMK